MTSESFPQEVLNSCDLVVGATYLSGSGEIGEEPINKLLQCGNQGGIRTRGAAGSRSLVVLYTTLMDEDWPDAIDTAKGQLVYYGDNKRPGHPLHETPKGGNAVFRDAFEALHVQPDRRSEVPPFFIFSRTGNKRDVRFEGLAVPGASGVPESADLIAIWKTTGSQRFQNYRAIFTILDAPRLSRRWIDDVVGGRGQQSQEPPVAWTDWVNSGSYRVLPAREAR